MAKVQSIHLTIISDEKYIAKNKKIRQVEARKAS